MDQQTLTLVGVVVVLAVIAIAAWLLHRRRETERLEKHFGGEYGRAVQQLGSRDKAEAELRARERRVQKMRLEPLTRDDAEHFSRKWKTLQGRFVDSPQHTLGEADRLVRELMIRRGYPMADFERRAADISVDHPRVVDHFRAAQEIRARDSADTEDMRRAVMHYRALFDDLLEVKQEDRTAETETR